MLLRLLVLSAGLSVACGPRAETGPVLLIVVDTLRADHLGAYGYDRAASPHFDAWANSGRLYERAFATSSWTLPSFGSLYTGQLPSRHGAGLERWGKLTELPVLAELLRDHGFVTGAVVNNPFVSPEFGIDRGFQTYDYDVGSNEQSRRADDVVDVALRWIDLQESTRFFLVVHFFDPHMTYDAPSPHRGTFTAAYPSGLELPVSDLKALRNEADSVDEADRAFITAAYDEELRFVDSQLERLRSELDKRGLLSGALVILTADHGEELFEHGGFEHGHEMWQEILHVPLVFWGRAVRPGRETAPVSLVDVAPTVLEAVGIAPRPAMEGRSLWANLTAGEPLAARLLYAEGIFWGPERQAIIRWPEKLVVEPAANRLRLVDLSRDSGERAQLGASAGDRDELRALLDRHLAEARQGRAEAPRTEVADETRERLRALGYVQ